MGYHKDTGRSGVEEKREGGRKGKKNGMNSTKPCKDPKGEFIFVYIEETLGQEEGGRRGRKKGNGA